MIKQLITATTVLATGLGIAAAQDMGGAKLGVHVGANSVLSDEVSATDGETVAVFDADPTVGFAIGATAAFAVTETFSLEAEYTYRNNEIEIDALGLEEDLETSAFMANAILPMMIDESTTGYFGAGLGYVAAHDSDDDGAFGWQIKTGVDFDVEGRMIGVGLTYLNAEFGDEDDGLSAEYDYESLMATVRFGFGG